MVAAHWRGGGGGGGRRRSGSRAAWWSAGLLLLLLLLAAAAAAVVGAAASPPGTHGRRLICWQAMLQCQEEPECGYAYNQYAEACAPVLLGAAAASASSSSSSSSSSSGRRRCPSHCISALIQLNHTRRGPALEDCDCGQDENCRATKRAIEPCLPRTSSGGGGGNGGPGGGGGTIGCTEARRRCDWDSRCSLALSRYMAFCGKLFNGLRCTEECRAVIEDMLAVPKALLLNDCICDGLERPICESVKENMARLCFGPEAAAAAGPGSSGGALDGAALDEYYDEYEDEAPGPRAKDELDELAAVADAAGAEEEEAAAAAASPGKSSGSGAGPARAALWTLLSGASILLLALSLAS